MKTCTTCKVAKPLSGFATDKQRPDGKRPQCRECRNQDARDHRAINKLKAVEYGGGICKRCGISSKCLDIYDFHHRNTDEKEAELSKLMNNSWENLVKEIDKCDLLCSNCHKITHWELRNKI